MAGKKADIELTLEAVDLEAAAGFKGRSQRLFEVKLVWPRATVAQKTASKTLRLVDGQWRGEGRTWTERILFKETMHDFAGLEISVSKALQEGDAEALSNAAAIALLKILGEAAADATGAKVLEPLAELPFSVLAKQLGSSKTAQTAAVATYDVNVAQVASQGSAEGILLQIPLLACADITREARRNTKGSERTVKKVVFSEGTKIGSATFRLRAI